MKKNSEEPEGSLVNRESLSFPIPVLAGKGQKVSWGGFQKAKCALKSE